MNQPIISVICPVYQAEVYLERCVKSLLGQSFRNFELLLIDDGSCDRSGQLCDEYSQMDDRVRVFHKENGGVCSARNVGIREARGVFSIHVDPDDWVEPDYLELLYEKAKKEEADVVVCDYFLNWEEKELYQKQQPSGSDEKALLNDLLHGLHGSCWNKLVRRSCYMERQIVFPEHLTIWEDLYFNASLAMHPLKVAYVDRALYHYDYSINVNSLVRKGNKKSTDSQRWVIDQLAEHISPVSQLDELKIMTKERMFITPPQKGANLVEIYKEVNELYLSRKNYVIPLWRAMAITLRFPWIYPIAEALLMVDYRIREAIHRIVRLIYSSCDSK